MDRLECKGCRPVYLDMHCKFVLQGDVWQTNKSESASELYRPSDRRLSAKLVPTFCEKNVPRGKREGSLRPYFRFSGPESLLFFQVASQLYSQGWVDPVPDPLFLRKSGIAGNRTRASGSVVKCISEIWYQTGDYFWDVKRYTLVDYKHLGGTLFYPKDREREQVLQNINKLPHCTLSRYRRQ
jgi:hypothetical protein